MTRAFAIFILLLPSAAFAFPELVRHGYQNCTSCHVAPSGGGVLTEYGRELSGEVLSTWAKEAEGRLGHGLVKLPEWLNVGGDFRSVEIYRNTPQVSAYRFIWMQGDAEVAATYGKFTADVSAGMYMRQFQSRRYFLAYRPTDQITLRAGKFRLAYGLMDPDHTTPIHRGLNWDEGTESYNLEAAWLGENLNVYLTGDLGQWDSSLILDANKEKGAAIRVGVPFAGRFQVGMSYFHGVADAFKRDVFGPFAILGFTQHFFLLSEVDYQAFNGGPKGWVTWNRLNYEFIQGLHGYLTYRLSRSDFRNSAGQSSSWGIGSQWFPRPHFEFDLQWQFQSLPGFPGATSDYATLLLHYYL